jgi:hypothetical protein
LPESRGLIPLRGAHKALVESGYHCHIVNEAVLLDALGGYQLLLLPDQACLSGDVQEAVRRFVAGGGGLIGSYATSARAESGRLLSEFGLSDVFGVSLEGEYPYSVELPAETPAGTNYAYIVAEDRGVAVDIGTIPLVVHGRFLTVTPTTGRPLAALLHHLNPEEAVDLFAFGDAPAGGDSGYPAVTVNRYGQGQAIYVAGELFSAYWRSNAPLLRHLIRNLVGLVSGQQRVVLEGPPSVEVSLLQQGARLLVHLTNYHVEKAGGSRPLSEQVPPVRDVTVRVRPGFTPSRVMQMPEGRELAAESQDGALVIRVPEIGIHTCVVIEP